MLHIGNSLQYCLGYYYFFLISRSFCFNTLFNYFSGIQNACCEFLEQQLHPSNCLGIRSFAETHGCEQLRQAAEKYILKHFVDLVGSEEFLELSSEDLKSLIKCDNLTVSGISVCGSLLCSFVWSRNRVKRTQSSITVFQNSKIYLLFIINIT